MSSVTRTNPAESLAVPSPSSRWSAAGRSLAAHLTPSVIRKQAAAIALAAASLTGLGAIQSAEAQVPPATGPGLARFGPIDPVQGFPVYYEDRLGLRLQLCQNPEIGRAHV